MRAKSLSRSVFIFSMLCLGEISRAFAQEVINGDLTVNGTVEINHNNVFLGLAETWDGSALQPAFGLTINYAESPPTTGYSSAGHSTLIQRAAQELATFKWQSVSPTTGAIDLMQVSNEGLTLMSGNFLSQGTANILPNQTLTAGSASILTLGLADNRYLSKAGGTLTGNLTVTGTSLTVNGQNVLTESTGIRVTSSGEITGGGSSVTAWSGGIGIGGSTVSGNQAVGIGNLSYATGEYSVALGREANASGIGSVSLGLGATSVIQSVAIGRFAGAQTTGSVAIGYEARATQRQQIVLGNFNELAPWSPDVPSPTDWLFVVGNGTASNDRSNALVVRRSGDMEVKGTSLTVNGNPVLTQADSDLFLRHVDGSYIGHGAYATPFSSAVAVGHFARAGEGSIAIGAHTGIWEPGVSGTKSVAIGYAARSPGNYSISIGEGNWGGGAESVAIGRNATVHTPGGVAIGYGATSNQVSQVVLGGFNETTVYATTSSPTDAIFILGNGTADNARSNALVVSRNGDMEIKGSTVTLGTQNLLLNQTLAGGTSSAMTLGLSDARYLRAAHDVTDGLAWGTNAVGTTYHTVVLGHEAAGGQAAVSIGSGASHDGSGHSSVSIGFWSKAPSEAAVALGNGAAANGAKSLSFGQASSAQVANAIAIGSGSEANQVGQVVLGAFNETTVQSSTASPADALLILGNGTADNARSNALVVRRNGNMEVLGTSLTVNGAEVLTQAGASSLYVTQTAASAAYLLKTDAETLYQPKLPTNVTYLTTSDLTTIQTSIDEMIDADELDVALAGYLTTTDLTAIQTSIAAMIDETELDDALVNFQVAGNYLSSDPQVGLAYGASSSASASTSAAIGEGVTASKTGQVVVGRHNETDATATGPGTPVFVVGAGTGQTGDPDEKKNALVVRRDGDIHVKGVIRVMPAGNLSMAGFEQGPKPVEDEP